MPFIGPDESFPIAGVDFLTEAPEGPPCGGLLVLDDIL
jgi:hypothetical protein